MFIASTGLRERKLLLHLRTSDCDDSDRDEPGSPDCINNSSDNETSPNKIPEWILYFGIIVHCRFRFEQTTILRLNSGNFEIFYPSEFYSIISSRVKSVLKIIQNDTNFGYQFSN